MAEDHSSSSNNRSARGRRRRPAPPRDLPDPPFTRIPSPFPTHFSAFEFSWSDLPMEPDPIRIPPMEPGEVVDLTNDDDIIPLSADASSSTHPPPPPFFGVRDRNPLILNLPMLHFIAHLTEPFRPSSRNSDARDQTNLMKHYGGGFWKRRQSEVNKPTSEKTSSANGTKPGSHVIDLETPSDSSSTHAPIRDSNEIKPNASLINTTSPEETQEKPRTTARRRAARKPKPNVKPEPSTDSSTESSNISSNSISSTNSTEGNATATNDSSSTTENDIQAPPDIPQSSVLKDFRCTVCLDNIRDITATFCGHLFCEECILAAIDASSRCPICRCKLSPQEIHPLFV